MYTGFVNKVSVGCAYVCVCQFLHLTLFLRRANYRDLPAFVSYGFGFWGRLTLPNVAFLLTPKMTLNSWSSYHHLTNAGIRSICHILSLYSEPIYMLVHVGKEAPGQLGYIPTSTFCILMLSFSIAASFHFRLQSPKWKRLLLYGQSLCKIMISLWHLYLCIMYFDHLHSPPFLLVLVF